MEVNLCDLSSAIWEKYIPVSNNACLFVSKETQSHKRIHQTMTFL